MPEREATVDQERFASSKGRVAQVIYVVGALAAAFFAFFALVSVSLVVFDYYDGAVQAVVFNGVLAPISYGAGWAMRWMMNGVSTSIFDRWLRRV